MRLGPFSYLLQNWPQITFLKGNLSPNCNMTPLQSTFKMRHDALETRHNAEISRFQALIFQRFNFCKHAAASEVISFYCAVIRALNCSHCYRSHFLFMMSNLLHCHSHMQTHKAENSLNTWGRRWTNEVQVQEKETQVKEIRTSHRWGEWQERNAKIIKKK